MVHDGKRVELTDKVFGASLVTVLRALKAENRLDVEHFPSLETLLQTASEWGIAMHGMCMGEYYKVLNGIGGRLFKDKSQETVELEKARVAEWISTLPPEEEEEKETSGGDEDQGDEGENSVPWFEAKGADEAYSSRDFTLSRVWKEYKAYLRECPTVPLRGPPYWDISSWTDEERAEFTFKGL